MICVTATMKILLQLMLVVIIPFPIRKNYEWKTSVPINTKKEVLANILKINFMNPLFIFCRVERCRRINQTQTEYFKVFQSMMIGTHPRFRFRFNKSRVNGHLVEVFLNYRNVLLWVSASRLSCGITDLTLSNRLAKVASFLMVEKGLLVIGNYINNVSLHCNISLYKVLHI